MRPLKLRLDSFACFRGHPVELDFAGLELFAISGPTGAGKSSLLDAMIFALYGHVPRMGRQGIAEMISLGSDRMSVAFDFKAGDTNYRVMRAARRKGATEAQIEALASDGETARPLHQGVREVNEAVARILGLSFDAFTQAVVLPQGEFQRFLQSAPRERREILSKLLRLEIYTRMQQMATAKRDLLNQTVQAGERRLAEDFAEATPAKLAELQDEAAKIADDVKKLGDELDQAEKIRDRLRVGRERTCEYEIKRARIAVLEADEPRIRAIERQVEAARRAAPVLPLIKTARRDEKEADGAKTAHEKSIADRKLIELRRQESEGRLAQSKKEAEDLPALRARISELDQVIGRMEPRQGLSIDLAEAERRREGYAADLNGAREQRQRAGEELASAHEALCETETALAGIGFDSGLFDGLDGTREDTTGLANLRIAVNQKTTGARESEDQARDAEGSSTSAKAEAENIARRLDLASRQVRQIEQWIDEERHRQAVAVLRNELQPGRQCPVCEQAVAELPPVLMTRRLDALEEAVASERKIEQEARHLADQARDKAAASRATSDAARLAAERAKKQLMDAQKECEEAEQQLLKRVRGLIIIQPGTAIEEQVTAAYNLASERKRRYAAAIEARDSAAGAAEKIKHSVEGAATAIGSLQELLLQADSTVMDVSRHIAEIDEAVRKVTSAADPSAERERLLKRQSNIEAGLKTAEEADSAIAGKLSAVEARVDACERAKEAAEGRVQRSREQARDAAISAGFADEAEVFEAELDVAEAQRISNEVESYHRERTTVAERVRQLWQDLSGEMVTQDALQATEDAVTNLRDKHTEAVGSHAALDRQIIDLSRAIERAAALRQELETQRNQHSIYRSLALDLRSDRFQDFLLEETFGDLLAGASQRLWDLTGRYRFERRDQAFYVVDHDNARQLRSADTLSGGETFLASLALALQLSEQVQKAASAVALDSLFIDEGFGTLDPEALDAAASAIESLPVGGRMVGIITHIDELSSRLPARVRLAKATGGSQVTIEAA
jgi:exonuclease SbcC